MTFMAQRFMVSGCSSSFALKNSHSLGCSASSLVGTADSHLGVYHVTGTS